MEIGTPSESDKCPEVYRVVGAPDHVKRETAERPEGPKPLERSRIIELDRRVRRM